MDVDAALVRLARERGASLITVDHNLAKVAEALRVSVAQINALASKFRVPYTAGDEITVRLVKEGREHAQAVVSPRLRPPCRHLAGGLCHRRRKGVAGDGPQPLRAGDVYRQRLAPCRARGGPRQPADRGLRVALGAARATGLYLPLQKGPVP